MYHWVVFTPKVIFSGSIPKILLVVSKINGLDYFVYEVQGSVSLLRKRSQTDIYLCPGL